jgi:hypothetical protein
LRWIHRARSSSRLVTLRDDIRHAHDASPPEMMELELGCSGPVCTQGYVADNKLSVSAV